MADLTPSCAVIPTKNRPGFLRDCVDSIADQVHTVIVVDNGSTPPVKPFDPPIHAEMRIILREEYPPNISRLWNLGIDQVTRLAEEEGWAEWNVLVLNDDTVSPPGLVETLSQEMRATTAVCAYPDQSGTGRRILHTVPRPTCADEAFCGYCFMLRGEAGLRADEDFVWWFGDNDLSWRACQSGGCLLVPGVTVEHRAPHVQTRADPRLNTQTHADHLVWQRKWGFHRP
jgi:glycosyltransferase involved in cell wall biosynthesis